MGGGLLSLQLFSNFEAGQEGHVHSLMEFTSAVVLGVSWRMKQSANIVDAGWSNLRRKKTETVWCSSGPLDNVRLALQVKTDMITSTHEVVNYIGQLREASNRVRDSSEHVTDKLEEEVKFYTDLWMRISKK